jgi:hypothetical protein
MIIHLDQTRAPANVRGKKLPPSVSSSKKNISVVKEEDEDIIEEVNISKEKKTNRFSYPECIVFISLKSLLGISILRIQ